MESQRKNRKFKIRNISLLIIIYFIIGSSAPFIIEQQVSADFKQEFVLPDILNSELTVSDYAAIIEDGMDALSIRLQMIEQAENQIRLSTFDMRNDNSSQDVIACLIAAADRGVQVEILVDGLAGSMHMSRKSLFYAAGNHPNIEFKFYQLPSISRPWRLHGRMHDKILIVDDNAYLIGGRNNYDYFLGDYEPDKMSYDREVLVYNNKLEKADLPSSIYEIIEYFDSLWSLDVNRTMYGSEPRLKNNRVETKKFDLSDHYKSMQSNPESPLNIEIEYSDILVPVDQIHLINNPIHTKGKEPLVWFQMIELMKSAESKVVIQSPYAVFNKAMYDDITEICQTTDQVELLLNSKAVGDNLVALSDYRLNKKNILNTGVDLYEFKGENSVHAKSISIDSEISIIGSFNFDRRSKYIDTETMLIIKSKELNEELNYNFNYFKEQSLRAISADEYEKNSDVKPVNPKWYKRILMVILSWILQPFRFLI